MKVDLTQFNPCKNFNRGASLFKFAIWYFVKMFFLLTPFPWPSSVKRGILRIFGAKIGTGVVIKPRVNIHFPWKLSIGDFSWIGEEALILNFEEIKIGTNACISQRVFLCSGNHDYRDPHMTYKHAPILISQGAWVGAQSFVGPGVTIGEEAVVTAGSVVTKNLPAGMICSGNPALPKKSRWIAP